MYCGAAREQLDSAGFVQNTYLCDHAHPSGSKLLPQRTFGGLPPPCKTTQASPGHESELISCCRFNFERKSESLTAAIPTSSGTASRSPVGLEGRSAKLYILPFHTYRNARPSLGTRHADGRIPPLLWRHCSGLNTHVRRDLAFPSVVEIRRRRLKSWCISRVRARCTIRPGNRSVRPPMPNILENVLIR